MLVLKVIMTCRYHKILASLTVAAGVICFLGAPPSTRGDDKGGSVNVGTLNSGAVTTPDGGASFLLLALGCSGLAIAARKRFKRS